MQTEGAGIALRAFLPPQEPPEPHLPLTYIPHPLITREDIRRAAQWAALLVLMAIVDTLAILDI